MALAAPGLLGQRALFRGCFRDIGEEENEVAVIVLIDNKCRLLAVPLLQQRASVRKNFGLVCDLLLSDGPVRGIARNEAGNRPLQGLAELGDLP
jgi:hypothetical protein